MFKLGNKKLGKDTIVFNMTSGHDCPAAKMCRNRRYCYAVADERLWKTPLAYRRRQAAFWKTTKVSDFLKSMPIPKYFRFSESGDFSSQEDVDKMTEIAKRLKKRGITTYGYTNRSDLDFSGLSKFAVVNGNGFMVNNVIEVVEKPEGKYVCGGDCKVCDWCKKSTGKTILMPLRKRG